jgi:hypothetical protein
MFLIFILASLNSRLNSFSMLFLKFSSIDILHSANCVASLRSTLIVCKLLHKGKPRKKISPNNNKKYMLKFYIL